MLKVDASIKMMDFFKEVMAVFKNVKSMLCLLPIDPNGDVTIVPMTNELYRQRMYGSDRKLSFATWLGFQAIIGESQHDIGTDGLIVPMEVFKKFSGIEPSELVPETKTFFEFDTTSRIGYIVHKAKYNIDGKGWVGGMREDIDQSTIQHTMNPTKEVYTQSGWYDRFELRVKVNLVSTITYNGEVMVDENDAMKRINIEHLDIYRHDSRTVEVEDVNAKSGRAVYHLDMSGSFTKKLVERFIYDSVYKGEQLSNDERRYEDCWDVTTTAVGEYLPIDIEDVPEEVLNDPDIKALINKINVAKDPSIKEVFDAKALAAAHKAADAYIASFKV